MSMGTRYPTGKNTIRGWVWKIFEPMGIKMGMKLYPMGKMGMSIGTRYLYPFTHPPIYF
jgi:hypothetical protein